MASAHFPSSFAELPMGARGIGLLPGQVTFVVAMGGTLIRPGSRAPAQVEALDLPHPVVVGADPPADLLVSVVEVVEIDEPMEPLPAVADVPSRSAAAADALLLLPPPSDRPADGDALAPPPDHSPAVVAAPPPHASDNPAAAVAPSPPHRTESPAAADALVLLPPDRRAGGDAPAPPPSDSPPAANAPPPPRSPSGSRASSPASSRSLSGSVGSRSRSGSEVDAGDLSHSPSSDNWAEFSKGWEDPDSEAAADAPPLSPSGSEASVGSRSRSGSEASVGSRSRSGSEASAGSRSRSHSGSSVGRLSRSGSGSSVASAAPAVVKPYMRTSWVADNPLAFTIISIMTVVAIWLGVHSDISATMADHAWAVVGIYFGALALVLAVNKFGLKRILRGIVDTTVYSCSAIASGCKSVWGAMRRNPKETAWWLSYIALTTLAVLLAFNGFGGSEGTTRHDISVYMRDHAITCMIPTGLMVLVLAINKYRDSIKHALAACVPW